MWDQEKKEKDSAMALMDLFYSGDNPSTNVFSHF